MPADPAHKEATPPKDTYSDIMETLKLLEEVPAPLEDSKAGRGLDTVGYLSAENLKKLGTTEQVHVC